MLMTTYARIEMVEISDWILELLRSIAGGLKGDHQYEVDVSKEGTISCPLHGLRSVQLQRVRGSEHLVVLD